MIKTITCLVLAVLFFGFTMKPDPARQASPSTKIVLSLDDNKPSTISLLLLSRVTSVKASPADKDSKITYKVDSYTLTISKFKPMKGEKPYTVHEKGGALSPTTKSKLKYLVVGDVVIMNDVKATGSDGSKADFPGSTVWRITS